MNGTVFVGKWREGEEKESKRTKWLKTQTLNGRGENICCLAPRRKRYSPYKNPEAKFSFLPLHLPFSFRELPDISKEYGMVDLSTKGHIGPGHSSAPVAGGVFLNRESLSSQK